MNLERAIQKGKQLRVLGIDDAPFDKKADSVVNLVGIICSQTRFEGMLWTDTLKDGTAATEAIIKMVSQSKFYQQLHFIMIDGIAVGGFNVIDLPQLSQQLNLPCIAVMRHYPNLSAIDAALHYFDDYSRRSEIIKKAGAIYQQNGFVYQASGCSADIAAIALQQVTDTGHVPEALRLAHFIGAAVKTGESSQRA